ncbi:hypothetical protein [Niabella ginsenosidivorans]|nr:hypothetical protein [Niabella ginsenosidivorans]
MPKYYWVSDNNSLLSEKVKQVIPFYGLNKVAKVQKIPGRNKWKRD